MIRPGFTISGMMKLLVALRFYRVGAHYIGICDMFGVSHRTVNIIVWEVSYIIAIARQQFIFMPTNDIDILNAKAGFMAMANFPLCIAAVDGTHVPIQSFGGPEAELYRNRHMFFSINVQLAVSADVSVEIF